LFFILLWNWIFFFQFQPWINKYKLYSHLFLFQIWFLIFWFLFFVLDPLVKLIFFFCFHPMAWSWLEICLCFLSSMGWFRYYNPSHGFENLTQVNINLFFRVCFFYTNFLFQFHPSTLRFLKLGFMIFFDLFYIQLSRFHHLDRGVKRLA
jgi:hypothetical protein